MIEVALVNDGTSDKPKETRKMKSKMLLLLMTLSPLAFAQDASQFDENAKIAAYCIPLVREEIKVDREQAGPPSSLEKQASNTLTVLNSYLDKYHELHGQSEFAMVEAEQSLEQKDTETLREYRKKSIAFTPPPNIAALANKQMNCQTPNSGLPQLQ